MVFWAKIWKSNRLLRDIVITEDTDDTRTHRIFHALEEVCLAFDLGRPIWLEANIRDFQRHKKTRFNQDCFIEEISFDYLEFMILEE